MSAAPMPTPGAPIVLDTNTVMALWHFRDPRLPTLRAACKGGRLALATRPDCLEELRRVLAYPQFGIAPAAQEALWTAYRDRCAVLPQAAPEPELPRCRDGDDQKFLELATQAAATLLVTRDKALLRLARHRVFRERLQILTPERLEALLAA